MVMYFFLMNWAKVPSYLVRRLIDRHTLLESVLWLPVVPIGSVLVLDGEVIGRGHNRRVQKGSAVLHAEMDALEDAGRLAGAAYRRTVLYSTQSPCDMCSGAVLLYGIPRVVVGETRTFRGPEDYLRSRGVDIEIVDDPECRRLMETFIAESPELWNEDIGEP